MASSSAANFINSSKIATAVTYKLIRTNFLLWKAQVVPILEGVKLFGCLDRTMEIPTAKITVGTGEATKTKDKHAHDSWITKDQAIIGGLLSSMTERCFVPTHQGDMSVAEYYQKMTGLADTMANIGHPMTDKEVIGYILAGLGPGHGDLFTAITVVSNNQEVKLSEFYSYLITHEA
uniref:Retrotransposon Copia-like N-terminal domain-containing protein n=1 Tax=Lactuca sativa TaxID=4236 RepID=A0A9R1UPM5_LACSA|nr:hypothetical protein LSAT_V11C800418970 [Lactuca sativa]